MKVDIFPLDKTGTEIVKNKINCIKSLQNAKVCTKPGFPMQLVITAETETLVFNNPTVYAVDETVGVILTAISCHASGELANLKEFLFIIEA